MQYLTARESQLQARAQKLLRLRNRHFLLIDLLIFALTPTLALLLRVETLAKAEPYWPTLVRYTLLTLVARLVIFVSAGLYRRFWRYAGSQELGLVLWASLGSALATGTGFTLVRALTDNQTLPRAVPVLDVLLMVLLVTISRVSIRLTEQWHRSPAADAPTTNVVIIGAGHTGELIAREIQAQPQLNLHIVAFLDDDPVKHQMQIRGVPVSGGLQALPTLLNEQSIGRVIIAMSAAPPAKRCARSGPSAVS